MRKLLPQRQAPSCGALWRRCRQPNWRWPRSSTRGSRRGHDGTMAAPVSARSCDGVYALGSPRTAGGAYLVRRRRHADAGPPVLSGHCPWRTVSGRFPPSPPMQAAVLVCTHAQLTGLPRGRPRCGPARRWCPHVGCPRVCCSEPPLDGSRQAAADAGSPGRWLGTLVAALAALARPQPSYGASGLAATRDGTMTMARCFKY